jgi:sugar diacid utilization regulator
MKYLKNTRPVELPDTVALNNLLKNIPLSTEESEVLSLDTGECWICFKLCEKKTQNYLPVDYMYATLSALMSGSVYSTVHDGAIVGLIKLEQSKDGSNNNTLNFFQEFLQKMGYIAGLSDEFIDVTQINIYLQQANYAVDKGSQTCNENRLFHFSDYALLYMLSKCTGQFSAEYLYSKGLHILIEYDKNNHINYIETLDIYLKNEMNATQTAKELFLHRSSLLKRLNKINKLLCADLNNPDTRLYLRICLYLLRNKN